MWKSDKICVRQEMLHSLSRNSQHEEHNWDKGYKEQKLVKIHCSDYIFSTSTSAVIAFFICFVLILTFVIFYLFSPFPTCHLYANCFASFASLSSVLIYYLISYFNFSLISSISVSKCTITYLTPFCWIVTGDAIVWIEEAV